jgi:YbgC/YbaW family acyl-CoA thioester hydrolase
MPESLHEVVFHIYPTECDMLGHLNHATMLVFLERARWALWGSAMGARELAMQPAFPVIRHLDIDYRAQALPGDDMAVRTGIVKVGNTSFTVRQEARIERTGQVVAQADFVVVAIDRSGKPIAVPESWTKQMPVWPDAAGAPRG